MTAVGRVATRHHGLWLLPGLVAGLVACTETTDAVGGIGPAGIDPLVPSAVDAMVFLVGDAGAAEEGLSPLMVELREDVESWAGALPDSAVMVVFLGDNVYESGLHDPGERGYDRDTLRLHTQVRAVTGLQASRHGARATFIPGNHDWANSVGAEGLARVRNMEGRLRLLAADGTAAVGLEPEPGTPGPTVLDVGTRARILALDTHWWLSEEDGTAKSAAETAMADAIRSAGQRRVLVAAHHPLASGGPHGGTIPFLPTLGIQFLAHKGGLLVQDMTSTPYRELIQDFEGVFRESGPPLAVASGHDHSLQVLDVPLDETDGYVQLVSGAGSGLTRVRPVPGMAWARRAPGYMRLAFLTEGGVILHVVAGSPELVYCGAAVQVGACMSAGVDSVHVVYSRRLR